MIRIGIGVHCVSLPINLIIGQNCIQCFRVRFRGRVRVRVEVRLNCNLQFEKNKSSEFSSLNSKPGRNKLHMSFAVCKAMKDSFTRVLRKCNIWRKLDPVYELDEYTFKCDAPALSSPSATSIYPLIWEMAPQNDRYIHWHCKSISLHHLPLQSPCLL